jgi:probable phosphoglycerate mutase
VALLFCLKYIPTTVVAFDRAGSCADILSNTNDNHSIPMPTLIFLVRHGATTLTAEDRFAGSSDVSLSEEGRSQVRSLARRLETEQLHAVYCSPLDRTVETASILAGPHNLEPIREPGLREIDYGHWESLRRSEIETQFADEYAAWQEDPFTIGPRDGESGVNVLNRALPVMRRIVEDNRHKNVLVVAHKGVNRILISSLLGFDVRGYRDRLDQSPAGLSVLDFMSDVHARLRLLNDVSHYEGVPARILTERLSAWWGTQKDA